MLLYFQGRSRIIHRFNEYLEPLTCISAGSTMVALGQFSTAKKPHKIKLTMQKKTAMPALHKFYRYSKGNERLP